jgi:hypothetical protein
MSMPGDHTQPTRTGPRAAAVGLNLSLAGMCTMAATALGWAEESAFWSVWLALAACTTLLTTRRLCRAMAPLFWITKAPPGTPLAVLKKESRSNGRLGLPHPSRMTAPRNRKALPITEAELKLMASAAIMGESSQPVKGYSRPAARGMPSAL